MIEVLQQAVKQIEVFWVIVSPDVSISNQQITCQLWSKNITSVDVLFHKLW